MLEIDIKNKSFGTRKVLENIKLKVNKGEIIAITGESGSGKTSFLNIIGLFDNDFIGEIRYDNKIVSKQGIKSQNKFIRNSIGYLFQNYALIDNETVADNLLLAMEYSALSKKEKALKVHEALREFNIEQLLSKKVYTLSGGEQQRVALARLKLKPYDIILADEPTGNLDKRNSEIVMEFLQNEAKKGKIVMVVTHNEILASSCLRTLKLSQNNELLLVKSIANDWVEMKFFSYKKIQLNKKLLKYTSKRRCFFMS